MNLNQSRRSNARTFMPLLAAAVFGAVLVPSRVRAQDESAVNVMLKLPLNGRCLDAGADGGYF